MNSMRKRSNLQYTNQSTKYQSNISNYSHQYFNIYIKRLEQIRPILAAKAASLWGDLYPVVKLRDLSESHYDSCIIIGTIFKHQHLKPSILKQLAAMEQLIPQPPFTGKLFADNSDILYLEDEDQRFLLKGNISARKLVSGVTVAVLAAEISLGTLKVDELLFAGLNNYLERPLFKNEDMYVVFISGLDITNSLDCILPFKLLVQWISGELSNLYDIDASKVTRLVIAGNSVSNKTNLQNNNADKELAHINTLDQLLLNAVKTIDVDLMPGEYDPTSYVLPQRPLHHCLFPQTAHYRSMNFVSNPYAFNLKNNEIKAKEMRFLGTSGSPVHDVIKYAGDLCTAIEAMEECLKWGHIAPTAPDTLGCYPFANVDPFVIGAAPHVFFAGNQDGFETKVCPCDGGEVRLIAIPEFSKTREVCVLNLRNFDCFTICFDVIV